MITTAPPLLFRFRETVATLPSALALIALVLLGVQQTVRLTRHADEPPVQISLMEPVPLQEARPATKPEAPRPLPQATPPKPKTLPPPTPKPLPQPAAKPSPDTASASTPVVTSTPELPPPAPHAVQAPAQPPAPAPAPAPAKPAAASLEADYVGKLRAHLNSIKRYPTGREASQQRPQGKVRIWFVLKRDGSVVDVGIDTSSNSMLLDDAARKTIHRASFSAFPENTWAGESTHRFTAELDFIPAG